MNGEAPNADTILVLTQPADATADFIIQELERHNAQVFRMDTADFPLSLRLSARFDGAWQGSIGSAGTAVELSDIRSVYVRRPTAFAFPSSMTDAEQRFAAKEARRGLGGLLMSLPCYWMNHPSRAADAEYKPFQLTTAVACGLDVPRTVITNVPGDAQVHTAHLGSAMVYKTLASASVADGHDLSLVHTSPVTPQDLADSRVSLTAHQFQQRVPKVRDVRATVVGKRIFAANILARQRELLDWRADYGALDYEVTQLPAHVESALLCTTERLGLSFAAADFVVTADERYYFVDLNPGGQWGWVQKATGLPIAAAIAAELMGGGS